MAEDSIYISEAFLKDFDPKLQTFLIAVDRVEKEILRLDIAVSDLKVGCLELKKSLMQAEIRD